MLNIENLGIIIQGPTNYVEEIIKCWNGVSNVFWSTWVSEPEENLQLIKESSITLILSTTPQISGYLHCNYQCLSTYNGINKISENSHLKYFVKVRSDQVISDINQFKINVIESLVYSDISFIAFHTRKSGYLLDYIVAGTQESLLKYWVPEVENEDSGRPFPEYWLQFRYYQMEQASKKDWFNFVKKNISIISMFNIEIYSLKWNYSLKQLPELWYWKKTNKKSNFFKKVFQSFNWILKKYILKHIPIQQTVVHNRMR